MYKVVTDLCANNELERSSSLEAVGKSSCLIIAPPTYTLTLNFASHVIRGMGAVLMNFSCRAYLGERVQPARNFNNYTYVRATM